MSDDDPLTRYDARLESERRKNGLAPPQPDPAGVDAILRYLYARPPVAEVLRRALEWEARGNPGFRWQHVRILPKELNRLVIDGLFDRLEMPGAVYAVSQPLEAREALRRFNEERDRVKVDAEIARKRGGLPPLPAGVPQDLFDGVLGYTDVKRQFLMALGSKKPVHVLLHGAPATGKTLFMEALGRLPGAVRQNADTVTKAGLRRVVTNERPRYLVLDELEKMSPEQNTILLSLMDGMVGAMNYNETYLERIELRVFSAANDLRPIRKELRSRFHKVTIRDYTPEEFRFVATNYLVKRGVPGTMAERIATGVSEKSRDLRDAIRVADMANGPEDVEFLIASLNEEARV